MTYRPSIAERIAWTSGQLSSAEVKVLITLASCGDWETGRRCHPSVQTIVARSGLSRATVTRALARLRNLTQPGGPWIVVTHWRRRHATTYDLCLDRLATYPPTARQIDLVTTVVVDVELEAQNEPSTKLEAQNEPQRPELEAQNEPPISLSGSVPVRTHTPRAREDAATADLPLLGQPPTAKCAHPNSHAWCEGRVHVPRALHFEFLDRLGAVPGETRAAKAGRLVAFYAADQTQLPATTSIGNPFTYWKAAFDAWVTPAAVAQAPSRPAPEVYAWLCPHTPRCSHRPACAIVSARKVG